MSFATTLLMKVSEESLRESTVGYRKTTRIKGGGGLFFKLYVTLSHNKITIFDYRSTRTFRSKGARELLLSYTKNFAYRFKARSRFASEQIGR